MVTDKETPLVLVRKWIDMMPECFELLDGLKKDFQPDSWPDLCYIPCSAATAVLTERAELSVSEATYLCAELTACYIWRQTKFIYRYDKDLAEELKAQALEMSDTDVIPIEHLMHLPYDCIYIKTNAISERFDGFFAWIEWDMNRQEYELRIQFLMTNMQNTLPNAVHLTKSTIGECLQDTIKEMDKQYQGVNSSLKMWDIDFAKKNAMELFQYALIAIQLILYIVSTDNDVKKDDKQNQIRRPRKPGAPIKDKLREVTLENVGVRVGNALRKSKKANASVAISHKTTDTTGTKKKTHMRRGHWHSYWVGAKESTDRKLVLKWTAPTIINPGEIDDNIIIFPVKKPN